MNEKNKTSPDQTIGVPTPSKPRSRKARKNLVAYIDSDVCTGCEACQDFCPTGCINTIPGEYYETIGAVNRIDETGCVGCFICLDYCRWEAIIQLPGHQSDSA
jgi:Pyruvate/2-oxoacid:ferredoxin oxidoreductase delta subunit